MPAASARTQKVPHRPCDEDSLPGSSKTAASSGDGKEAKGAVLGQTQPLSSGSFQPRVRDKHINCIKYKVRIVWLVLQQAEQKALSPQSTFPNMVRGLIPDLLSQSWGVGKEPSGKRMHTGVREALAEQEAVCLPWGEPGLDVGQGRPP